MEHAIRSEQRPRKHPGYYLKTGYLLPLGVKQKDFAELLGIHEKTLSAIINGKANVSTELAFKLGKLLNTSPELWINMQVAYDVWQAKQNLELDHLEPIVC